MELTVELGCCKYPPAHTLPKVGNYIQNLAFVLNGFARRQIWLDNKEALLRFAESAHFGVYGLVKDAETGRAIGGAKITVAGIDRAVVTTERGEYWRILTPEGDNKSGIYWIRAEAPGYRSSPNKLVVKFPGAAWPPARRRQDFLLVKSS